LRKIKEKKVEDMKNMSKIKEPKIKELKMIKIKLKENIK
jgi:hypothetical protein